MEKKIRVVRYGGGPVGGSIVRLMRQKQALVIVGAIDKDPEKAGRQVGGVVVMAQEEMRDVVRDKNIVVGVLAVRRSVRPTRAQLLSALLVGALLAIAGVALGGTSIFGGIGSVWRTVLGVLILGMITNGFNLLAVPDYWQNIVRGILIIAAVAISTLIERR